MHTAGLPSKYFDPSSAHEVPIPPLISRNGNWRPRAVVPVAKAVLSEAVLGARHGFDPQVARRAGHLLGALHGAVQDGKHSRNAFCTRAGVGGQKQDSERLDEAAGSLWRASLH